MLLSVKTYIYKTLMIETLNRITGITLL